MYRHMHNAKNESALGSHQPQSFTYGKNNTTNDNIDIYRKNLEQAMKQNTNLNLRPYNSFSNNAYQSSFQLQNQNSQNLDQRQNTFNNNEIIYETTTDNNIIENPNYENTYGNNNDINNTVEKKEEEEVIDPEQELFEQLIKDKKDKNKDEEDELSSYNEESYNENDFSNLLLAQYEKVKRVKNKWKVCLKGCIVQKDKKEYVCGKIHGELSREW